MPIQTHPTRMLFAVAFRQALRLPVNSDTKPTTLNLVNDELVALARYIRFAEDVAVPSVRPALGLGDNQSRLTKSIRMHENVAEGDALAVLIEPDAIELLLEMPNRYWFWSIVWQACMLDDFCARKLSAKAVQKALRDRQRTAEIPDNSQTDRTQLPGSIDQGRTLRGLKEGRWQRYRNWFSGSKQG